MFLLRTSLSAFLPPLRTLISNQAHSTTRPQKTQAVTQSLAMNFTANTLARVENCCPVPPTPPPPTPPPPVATVLVCPAMTEAGGGTMYTFAGQFRCCCSRTLAIRALALDVPWRPYACSGTIGQLYEIYHQQHHHPPRHTNSTPRNTKRDYNQNSIFPSPIILQPPVISPGTPSVS